MRINIKLVWLAVAAILTLIAAKVFLGWWWTLGILALIALTIGAIFIRPIVIGLMNKPAPSATAGTTPDHEEVLGGSIGAVALCFGAAIVVIGFGLSIG